MKIKNHTDIPNEVIRDIIRFVRPSGIKNFRVIFGNCGRGYHGHGGRGGIKVNINMGMKFPRTLHTYQYGQLKGRRYYLGSLMEAIIYITAHELMHVKQGQFGRIRGRVWGARGQFSEIETESYAIRKLREWRRLG